ncbi:MAG: hypothetical protein II207_01125 [Clostridia bacterium]|nr:hypothetical protein [Clostridia bacterium]
MDTAKRQKIHNAVCTAIAYGAKAFLTLMAVVFGLMFLVCLAQLFREPALGLIGCFGFGGGAWILWETQKAVQTR